MITQIKSRLRRLKTLTYQRVRNLCNLLIIAVLSFQEFFALEK